MTTRSKKVVTGVLLSISAIMGTVLMFWLAAILVERGIAVDNAVGYSTPMDTVMFVAGMALILIPVGVGVYMFARAVARERRAMRAKA